MDLKEEYKKYKWFMTSTGKIVIGGKSAVQNDELLRSIKSLGKDHYILHTSHPGSPFCAILDDLDKVTKSDLEECAIFTGCFSRAWKEGRKSTEVHLFKASQISKPKGAKTGTWFVKGNIDKKEVNLKLVMTIQNGVLRAVPRESVKNSKNLLLEIIPGKNDKTDMFAKFEMELEKKNLKVKHDELLAALPAGGVSIVSKKETKTTLQKKKTSKRSK